MRRSFVPRPRGRNAHKEPHVADDDAGFRQLGAICAPQSRVHVIANDRSWCKLPVPRCSIASGIGRPVISVTPRLERKRDWSRRLGSSSGAHASWRRGRCRHHSRTTGGPRPCRSGDVLGAHRRAGRCQDCGAWLNNAEHIGCDNGCQYRTLQSQKTRSRRTAAAEAPTDCLLRAGWLILYSPGDPHGQTLRKQQHLRGRRSGSQTATRQALVCRLQVLVAGSQGKRVFVRAYRIVGSQLGTRLPRLTGV